MGDTFITNFKTMGYDPTNADNNYVNIESGQAQLVSWASIGSGTYNNVTPVVPVLAAGQCYLAGTLPNSVSAFYVSTQSFNGVDVTSILNSYDNNALTTNIILNYATNSLTLNILSVTFNNTTNVATIMVNNAGANNVVAGAVGRGGASLVTAFPAVGDLVSVSATFCAGLIASEATGASFVNMSTLGFGSNYTPIQTAQTNYNGTIPGAAAANSVVITVLSTVGFVNGQTLRIIGGTATGILPSQTYNVTNSTTLTSVAANAAATVAGTVIFVVGDYSGIIQNTDQNNTIVNVSTSQQLTAGMYLTRISGAGAFDAVAYITKINSPTQITVAGLGAATAGAIVFSPLATAGYYGVLTTPGAVGDPSVISVVSSKKLYVGSVITANNVVAIVGGFAGTATVVSIISETEISVNATTPVIGRFAFTITSQYRGVPTAVPAAAGTNISTISGMPSTAGLVPNSTITAALYGTAITSATIRSIDSPSQITVSVVSAGGNGTVAVPPVFNVLTTPPIQTLAAGYMTVMLNGGPVYIPYYTTTPAP